MKFKYLMYSLLLLVLFSCSNDDYEIPEPEYYQFEGEDFDKLLSYEINQSLVFRNQNGEERSYSVVDISDDFKTAERSFGWSWLGQSPPDYYYAKKEFEFEYENCYCPKIEIMKKPIFHEGHGGDVFSGTRFYALIRSFPKWLDDYIYIDLEANGISMIINGVNYSDVHIINSENTDSQNQYENINIFYYDARYGMVGFDDLDGMEWRLVN